MPDTAGPPCRRERLAAADFAMIERCSCGSLHLTIGALTLRLCPEALLALAVVVGDAARALTLAEARAQARPAVLS